MSDEHRTWPENVVHAAERIVAAGPPFDGPPPKCGCGHLATDHARNQPRMPCRAEGCACKQFHNSMVA